jgi:hypothetical protein
LEDFFSVVCEKNERILFTVKSTGKMLKKEQKNSWVSARSNREGDKWKWFELRQQRKRKNVCWKKTKAQMRQEHKVAGFNAFK